ncbi:Crp/Fnr family transcriptional regulator [Pedobacter chinensis]|uniref:Crp/Fnr family transcriptional regulator n=1 Tax=Pedobacter chinensis TaxID=2282421 RepID=A0A369PW63_9SPHI|nr:Crp/Fnr family transcriptional regulator [Pedobacter chinensis]RDC56502.1 Crp/Fnr family transcriptional regulator [Pedobacter chinensis]
MEAAIQTYLESLKSVCGNIGEEDLSQMAARLKVKEYRKKDFFLEAGKVQKDLGFIVNGLVRSYFVDDDGDEKTVGFYPENDYATHYAAFITKRPSQYFIQCLEPTTFVCLTLDDLQWIYQRSPVFERYGRLIAEDILMRQQARIESFIFQTAEERYLDFIKVKSALFNRISLSHLCSFLGIERQSLTRIRQKIAHK